MRPLCVIAAASRVFFGAVVDLPELYGASWLAGLLGGVLFLPFALIADALTRHDPGQPLRILLDGCGKTVSDILCVIIAVLLLWDAACMAQGVTDSAGYIALRKSPVSLLLFVLMAVIWYSVSCNGTGIGGSGRIWSRLIPLLAAAIFFLQLSTYRLGFLAPWLGRDGSTLLDGAFRCAGWYAALLPAWLISDPDERAPRLKLTPCLAAACLSSCLLMAMHGLETPPAQFADRNRVFQMDAIMTNGRFPLSLELPIIVMWFGSLLHLLVLEIFVSAALLQRVFRFTHGRTAAFFCAAAASAAVIADLAEQRSAVFLSGCVYPGAWIAAILLFLAARIRKAGTRKCENCT